MDNAPGSETSTVNGYVLSAINVPGGGPAMGGPARVFTGTEFLWEDVLLDVDICGRNIDYSKAVGFVPSALSGTQIIYYCGRDDSTAFWGIYAQGTDLVVIFGNGWNATTSQTFSGALANGVPTTVSFSVNWITQIARICLNGLTFTNKAISTYPYNLTLGGFVSAGGRKISGVNSNFFKGSIVAPTGWTRQLLDAEQIQWANSGSPWRL